MADDFLRFVWRPLPLLREQKGEVAMTSPIKPGTPAPASGQYIQVGPRGGYTGPDEVTAIQGKPMPPTDQPGQGWQIVDPTKHKG